MHSETGQAPLARLDAADPPRLPTPAELHEAFLWSQTRTVTKTATVSLHGNVYTVDAALVGRRVEIVFDPFDLTRVDIRYQGRPMGAGVPHRIGRHVHPHAGADQPPPAPATGINYLELVEAAHTADLARRIDYAELPAPPGELPGQLDRTELTNRDDRQAAS